MSTTTKQAIDLMEILPESEQNFALEFIKKLVLAWDCFHALLRWSIQPVDIFRSFFTIFDLQYFNLLPFKICFLWRNNSIIYHEY